MRVSTSILSLCVLSLAAPDASATPCGTNIGTSEIAIELDNAIADLRIYDRNGIPAVPDLVFGVPNTAHALTVALRSNVAGCDYFVGFPPGGREDAPSKYILFTHTVAFPITVEVERLIFRPGTVQGDEPETLGIDRYVYNGGSSGLPTSFFYPLGQSNADVYFSVEETRTRVSPNAFWNLNGGAGLFIDEAIPDDGWVYPYYRDAICAVVSCALSAQSNASPQTTDVPFVMPIDHVLVYGQPLTKSLTPAVSMTFSALRTVSWTEDWLTLAFAPGTSLVTESPDFQVSNVSLTASDAVQGWGGIRVDGGHATLGTGTTVSGVTAPAGNVRSTAAGVTVTAGGSATLDGAQIYGTTGGAGLYVTGKNAFGYVTSATQVFDNAAGPGIRVDAGGAVQVDGDEVQIYGNAEGILASGSGSLATVTGGQIHHNTGPGVRATTGARADVLHFLLPSGGGTPSVETTSTLPIRLTLNAGGLYASGTGRQPGGVVSTEANYVCKKPPCYSPVGQNDFRQNNFGAAYDASARMGSQILATYNYWGTTNPDSVQVEEDGSSDVLIDPILTAAPDGGSAAARSAEHGATQTAGKGRVEAGVQALITEADRAAQASDSTLAATHLLAAWARGTTDDDRLAVAEAAGRILTDTQPAALVAWAETAAASQGEDRPWGRRTLALSLAGQDRLMEAAAVAQALASEDGAGAGETAESHHARGLALLVGIAVAGRDSTGALAALNALASVDPEGAADAMLPVAVAFPTLDLSLALGNIAAGQGEVEAGKMTATTTASVRAPVEFSVRPNPSAGAFRVSLTLVETADVRVVVFDALGREVAVLHEGPAPLGALGVSLDGTSLPAGVYVVRATVRYAAGTSVLTRTVTVAR